MAVEIGRYTAAVQQENGTTVAERGKFVQVWRRLGIWLMATNCWNSDLPAGNKMLCVVAGDLARVRPAQRQKASGAISARLSSTSTPAVFPLNSSILKVKGRGRGRPRHTCLTTPA